MPNVVTANRLVDGIVIRMKVTSGRAKPEFDDVALVATKTGAPLH